mgnify:CR=1 FL=1
MKCPYCSYEESKVIDSRSADDGERIRRRRECLRCGKRFTTHEVIETVPIIVVKRDKSREVFDRNKLTGVPVRSVPFQLNRLKIWSMILRLSFSQALTVKSLQSKSVSLQWISSKILTRFHMSVLRQFIASSRILTPLWTNSISFLLKRNSFL